MLWNMVLHILSVIEGYLLAVYTWPVVQALLGRSPAGGQKQDPKDRASEPEDRAGESAAAYEGSGRIAAMAGSFRHRLEALARGRTAAAVKDWFLRSATILWARLVALAGLVLAGLDWLASFAGLPGVSENIRAVLAPQVVPWYLIAIAVITELARRRTLPRTAVSEPRFLAGVGDPAGDPGASPTRTFGSFPSAPANGKGRGSAAAEAFAEEAA